MRDCVHKNCLPPDYTTRQTLTPESKTNYGSALRDEFCLKGKLATAYELKYYPLVGGDIDDTGVSGLKFRCSDEDKSEISYIGDYGPYYQGSKLHVWGCPNNWYLNAIKVNSEPDQGGSTIFGFKNDDMALTNVKVWCKNPRDGSESMNEGPADMPDDATWTRKETCQAYYGIVGLKLQIEDYLWGDLDDNTALNKITVYCESIINYMNATIDDRK